jgi:hypothetical protein
MPRPKGLKGPIALTIPTIAALAAALSACGPLLTEGAGAGAGIAGAGIAGAVTKNAAITSGIGLGVNAAALAGVKALEKSVHKTEQEQIAQVAGPLDVGQTAPWSISHRMRVERNEHGVLTVSRLIRAGDLDCKEVIFSVDTVVKMGPQRAFYTTTVCRDGQTWKWASAEPATERWGALQ